MHDRIYQHHQANLENEARTQQTTRTSMEREASELLPAFQEKVQHLADNNEVPYPFPLNGSDILTTYNGEDRHGWYLGADYEGPTFVYVLDDGTLVKRKDIYDRSNAVEHFTLTHATDQLLTEMLRTLRLYTTAKDEDLEPITKHSRALGEDLRRPRG